MAGRCSGCVGECRGRPADFDGVSADGAEYNEDRGGGGSGGWVCSLVAAEGGRRYCAVAECAWGRGVCSEVPAGAEVPPSDRTGGCAAGDPDGAGERGGVRDFGGPCGAMGLLRGRASGGDGRNE